VCGGRKLVLSSSWISSPIEGVAQIVARDSLALEQSPILSTTLRIAPRSMETGIFFHGWPAMQGVILGARRARDIGSNPEGYESCVSALTRFDRSELVRTPMIRFRVPQTMYPLESFLSIRRALAMAALQYMRGPIELNWHSNEGRPADAAASRRSARGP
jgi:hypothetical protein